MKFRAPASLLLLTITLFTFVGSGSAQMAEENPFVTENPLGTADNQAERRPGTARAERNTARKQNQKQAARQANRRLEERPLIGINMDISGDRDSTGSVALRLSSSYVDAITSAGGIPIVLPPVQNRAALRRYADLCDGFVFVGGGDINPQRYGETSSPEVRLLHPRRESFDFALWDAVLKTRKPVLGVCLGCQELNVARGGSLIQDLPTETSSTIDHRPGSPRSGFAHDVELTTGTRLADLLGTTTLGVNSIHHQAIDVTGRGLRVAARAPDGVVEAIELGGSRFAVGVQWHPEALTAHREHLRVYQGLVNAAKKQKAAGQKGNAAKKPRQGREQGREKAAGKPASQ